MNKKLFFIMICFLSFLNFDAAKLVMQKGSVSSTATSSFSSKISDTAFDEKNGAFYAVVGESANPGSSSANVISRALSSQDTPIFYGVAPSTLQSSNFGTIKLIQGDDIEKPPLCLSKLVLDSRYTNTQLDKKVCFVSNDGKKTSVGSILKDAAGNDTEGILKIAASDSHVFALVKETPAAAATGKFGGAQNNGGIVAIEVNPDTLVHSVLGGAATKIDVTSAQFKINNDLTSITKNKACLEWNKHLGRLYIGLQDVTSAVAVSDGAFSVAMAYIDAGALQLKKIVPDAAIQTNNQDYIIGRKYAASNAIASAFHIKSMHTSTGLDYLIVNGSTAQGAAATNVPGNAVYALPLVMTGAANEIGTIAGRAQTIVGGEFNTQATAGTMPNTTAAPIVPFTVGGGTLPIQAAKRVSDMQVVGDTVYVALGCAADADNDTGIFYSQAQFDHEGKIIKWSPWAKRLVPDDILSKETVNKGVVSKFAVDATNGRVWAVDGNTSKSAYITSWSHPNQSHSLVKALNEEFPFGCYCALDLDESTNNLTVPTAGTPKSRYALFGGAQGKVCFAQTSISSLSTNNNKIIQSSIDAYLESEAGYKENFLVTKLPENTPVLCLGYTKAANAANANTFFAGTSKGLYVWTPFANPDDLGALNAVGGPFVTPATWQTTPIKGNIVDIKSLGNSVYVLSQYADGTHDIVYRISGNLTLPASFNNILATSGVAGATFANVPRFYSIELVSVDGTTQEQLMLATSNGIFYTGTAGGVQAQNALAGAGWQAAIAGITNKPFYYLTTSGQKFPNVVWALSLEQDEKEIFNKSSLFQICCDQAQNINPTLLPTKFNSKHNTNFEKLNRTSYFWSDGGRRFFAMQPTATGSTQERNTFKMIPFDTSKWGIPENLNHLGFDDADQIFWAQPIGATGMVLAGTNRGVSSLE